MKKMLFMLSLLTIGLLAPMAQVAQAQWGYYPYGGYYYRYTWDPFYDPFFSSPVVVYDPVRARQLEVIDNLEKLNRASNKLVTAANEATPGRLKDIEAKADDVAKYSHRLRKALSHDHADKVAPNFINGTGSLDQVEDAALTIDGLVKEVNSTDINIDTEKINYSNLQRTLDQLGEIERQALAIRSFADRRD